MRTTLNADGEPLVHVQTHVPIDLHRRLKIAAVVQGETVQAIIARAIETELRNSGSATEEP